MSYNAWLHSEQLLVAETTDKNPSVQKTNKQKRKKKAPSTEEMEKVCVADVLCRLGVGGGGGRQIC